MAKQSYDALSIPPGAKDGGGVEVLRAAVSGDNLTISLRRAFDDPQAWGALFATVARQVARVYAAEMQLGEEAVRERIRAQFENDMRSTDDPGDIQVIRR